MSKKSLRQIFITSSVEGGGPQNSTSYLDSVQLVLLFIGLCVFLVFVVISLNFHIFLSENGVLVCVYLCVCVIKIVKKSNWREVRGGRTCHRVQAPGGPLILTLCVSCAVCAL